MYGQALGFTANPYTEAQLYYAIRSFDVLWLCSTDLQYTDQNMS